MGAIQAITIPQALLILSTNQPILSQEQTPMPSAKQTQEQTPRQASRANSLASQRRALVIVFFLIAAITSMVDLGTKSWIFDRLGMPETSATLWIWDGLFGFQTALNEGALFGMGQGFVLAFAFLSIAMLAGIVIWILGPFRKNWFLVTVMGLISGGIFGNLYDRLGLHQLRWPDDTPVYAVRDWLLVMIGSYHWPNFNLADSCLVAGVILFAMYIWTQPSDKI